MSKERREEERDIPGSESRSKDLWASAHLAGWNNLKKLQEITRRPVFLERGEQRGCARVG